MTAIDRDPLTIAREVLELAHEDETITVCTIPDNKAAALARAVIDLTAKVKRVEDLADDMDHDADLLDQTDDLRLHLIAATHREDATRLRTALNGDNK